MRTPETTLGHEENNCQEAAKDTDIGGKESKYLGSWLKAEIIGSVVQTEKGQRKEDNEGQQARRQIHKQKMSEIPLEKLERLTMIEVKQEESETYILKTYEFARAFWFHTPFRIRSSSDPESDATRWIEFCYGPVLRPNSQGIRP
ncbi:hypothetical protein PIB30_078526 [Stylosanthes scabra]|uniref:Uncharacterized protein n=1 Tax=Stylosanthes scabra TaxID=79078 RepID=A0ABU6WQR3_9FABA|nr:hypothetical protein [Stylosanthes scabra]